jgi:hypothetical protein
VILGVSALFAVPFAVLDDDSPAQDEVTAEAEPTTSSSEDSSLDSDGDGIPDFQDSEPFENPEDEDAPSEGEGEPAGPEQTIRPVGGSATDDGVRFKLNSIQEVSSIPPSEYSDPIVAPDRAKLISAVLTVKNNGQTKIDPFCGGASGVVLLDERDRNYEAEDNVLDIAGNDWVCGDGISPGFKDDVTLAFEIPRRAEVGGLVVWNSDAENDYGGDVDQILFTP